MKPFAEARMPPEYTDPVRIRRIERCSFDEAQRIATVHRKERVFLNDRYQVNVRETEFPGVGPMAHLSIKRRDKEPIHDWRDLQEIKNALVGPECEGVELYPAESRLIDEANQFHLFVFTDPKIRFPIGSTGGRRVAGPEEAAAIGAKQRPFEETDR